MDEPSTVLSPSNSETTIVDSDSQYDSPDSPYNDENIDITNSNSNRNKPRRKILRKHHPRPSNSSLHSKITPSQLDQLENLFKFIKDGNFEQFDKLLREKTFTRLINIYINGHTALHYTLLHGRDKMWCKKLISNGANPNLTNLAGWHPIHLAAFNSTHETLSYLLEMLK